MPRRCARSWREVIGGSFCGNTGQYFCTGASRSSLPRSKSCRMATAVMDLEVEPRRYSVEEVAGVESAGADMPKPADEMGWAFCMRATETAGRLWAVLKRETPCSDW